MIIVYLVVYKNLIVFEKLRGVYIDLQSAKVYLENPKWNNVFRWGSFQKVS